MVVVVAIGAEKARMTLIIFVPVEPLPYIPHSISCAQGKLVEAEQILETLQAKMEKTSGHKDDVAHILYRRGEMLRKQVTAVGI